MTGQLRASFGSGLKRGSRRGLCFFGERWVGRSPGLRRGATVFCPLRGRGEGADSGGDV